MTTIFLVLLLGLVGSLEAVDCDKKLSYHEHYGYGIDIICEGLSDENQEMLRRISVEMQILLAIQNSNLTKVTAQLFTNLNRIKYLSIVNSTFEFNENDAIFDDLTKLEHFLVENTPFNINPHIFRSFNNLVELKLINASLNLIKNTTFTPLSNLRTLKLPRNHFRSLLDIPFCELPSLKYLNLERNEIEEIGLFVTCIDQESAPDFQLNGKSHKIKYKDNQYGQVKSKLNLVELNISHNKISKTIPFDWGTDLKLLDLSNNRLKKISENTFSMLVELEKLYLQNNLLHNVHELAFNNLHRLKIVNLSNNSLTDVTLQNLPYLTVINLSKNKLTTTCLRRITALHNLRELTLCENRIEVIGENEFHNFSSLQLLDLSHNNVVLSDNSFVNLQTLKKLFLRNNSLGVIPRRCFSTLSNLEVLDISANKLITLDDSDLFKKLQNLMILNISNNLLSNLNYETVKPLSNIQILDVSGNRLQNFQFSIISLLPSLRVIDIKSNILPCSILSNIIQYFKDKNISYTINENFELDKKNIEGIYCEEVAMKVVTTEDIDSRIRFSSGFGILFIFVGLAVVFVFVFYKCIIFSKRRRYRMDEMELI